MIALSNQLHTCLIPETAIKRDLTKSDLWRLKKSLDSKEITKKFEADWNVKANAYIRRVGSQCDETLGSGEHMKLNAGSEIKLPKENKIRSPSLLLSIAKVAGCNFVGIVLLEIVATLLKITGPMCLE